VLSHREKGIAKSHSPLLETIMLMMHPVIHCRKDSKNTAKTGNEMKN
jgi:hypothetical protein